MSRRNNVSNTTGIFDGLNFWVSQAVKGRNELLRTVREHGGQITPREQAATHCLVDPDKKSSHASPCVYDYKFVLESVEAQTLQDDAQYEVNGASSANRPVGDSLSTRKTTKTPFTAADDQILYDWITPFRERGGKYQGNAIYQQLQSKYPHHPYQSWRNRYLKNVQYRKGLKIIENIDPLDTMFEDTSEHESPRPVKRRRVELGTQELVSADLNQAFRSPRSQPGGASASPGPMVAKPPAVDQASESNATPSSKALSRHTKPIWRPPTVMASRRSNVAAVQASKEILISSQIGPEDKQAWQCQRRQELLNRTFRRVADQWPDFSLTQVRLIYRKIPELYQEPPEKLQDRWQEFLVRESELHALKVDQCDKLYRDFVFPEYRRRNALRTYEDLQRHMLTVTSVEDGGLLAKIKLEDISDLRTAAEKQRDKELARAQADAEDLLLSDDEMPETQKSHGPNNLDVAHASVTYPPDHEADHDTPASPNAGRSGAQANEGRKRASQSTTQSTTQSTSQDTQQLPAPATPRDRKKLFGNRLDLSPSASQSAFQLQNQLEYHLDQSKSNPTDGHPSTIVSSGDTKPALSSSSSLPTNFKPPVSYQVPRPTASTSQESETGGSALQTQLSLHFSSNPNRSIDGPEEPSQIDAQISSVVAEAAPSLLTEYLKEQPSDDADDEHDSETEQTDAASEWQGFDDSPAKDLDLYQANTEHETQPDIFNEDRHEETTSDTTSDEELIQRPLNTLLDSPQQEEHLDELPLSQHTIDSEEAPEGSQELSDAASQGKPVQHEDRIQTQTLFQVPIEDDPTMFDVAEPEGGWNALGLDDVDDLIPEVQDVEPALDAADIPLQTVEIVQEWLGTQSQPPEANDFVEADHGSEYSEQVQISHDPGSFATHSSSPVKHTHSRSTTQAKLARSADDPLSTVHELRKFDSESVKDHSMRKAATGPKRKSRNLPRFEFPSMEDLEAWEASQLAEYPEVESRILSHIANTVLQSTNNDMHAATLLLPGVVEKYHKWERQRAEQKRAKHLKFKPRPPRKKEMRSFLPGNIRGVWTSDDDAAFDGTIDSLKQIEKKHGKEGIARRTAFVRREADDDRVSEEEGEGDTTLVVLPQTPVKEVPPFEWKKRRRIHSP